jgi:hypothetical protein
MKMITADVSTEGVIRLSLFSLELFPDRAALRVWVSSEAFEEVAEAVWIVLQPESFHPENPASRRQHGFEFALQALLQDLLRLGRAAAAEDSAPLPFAGPYQQDCRAACAVALI